MSMLRTIKPKTARSKRVLDDREPKIVENEKTAIFVRGEKTSDKVRAAMKDLNPIHPFEDAASLEFFCSKNDASLFVVGSHNKKRPDGLTFVRCYNGAVMDMIEVGINDLVPMADLKTPKSTPGHRILMTFQSPLFSSHPSYILLKSILLDFYNGHEIESIPLMGLEAVMTVTAGPLDGDTQRRIDLGMDSVDELAAGKLKLPPVHIRVYTMKLLASGSRVPRVSLTEMGPRMDLSIRRIRFAPDDMMKEALKRPKMEKKDVEAGLGKRKKNIETDEMGDLVGKVHIGRQDLSGLQSRKMKGLKEVDENGKKKRKARAADSTEDVEMNGGGEGRGREKRAKKAESRAAAEEDSD